MDPTLAVPDSLPALVVAIDQKLQQTNDSVARMVDRINTPQDFSASVSRINRVLDEMTLLTDLLTLSNVLQASAAGRIKRLDSAA
jgi:hypothetical protein